ncbi:Thiosulfate dehydrogenase TsdA [Commensalibacter communis]|uniref:c-type cytochrome n=1 Tax=Commensalibacter communis TaxID=2972786 RepID=UPI0022FF6FCB|nr:cytochrome c [Commensalibacter communis]CAI3957998.1 Thiosulfate dehydrogenase TsdA [Commensalibacter communis]CAI3958251.1 Thiosulfate dehydrogenase TsdA [Commensalibacter communis]
MKRLSILFLMALPSIAHANPTISKGEYVFRASDCGACHTAPDGKELAGGVKFPTPLGNIYSTNITPDKTNGIGDWSYNDFVRAVRKGVGKGGRHLYPAMPYPSYVKLSDEDMRALYEYLIHDVKPQAVANRPSDISWPLSIRWPISVWNAMYTENKRFQPRADQSEQWNRGAYLVQGPGHCGTCHTPRGYGMQEKSFDEQKGSYLSGAQLAGWYAPSLRNLPFSKQETIDLLKKGRSEHKALAGPMDEVVSESTQYLTDQDLDAVATYLADIDGNHHVASAVTQANTRQAKAQNNGEFMYMRYCSTCHGMDGKGNSHVIPPLQGNLTVNSEDPLTLVRVILEGGKTPVTQDHLPYSMPGYQWVLTNKDTADVINYIRSSWGNHAHALTPEDIQNTKDIIKKN